MNILYHHRTQGTGAEGVHIAYIIKGFRELGYIVRVVSPADTEPLKTAGKNPYREKEGFKSRSLDWLSRNLPQFLFELLELGYNAAAYLKLRKVLKNQPIQFMYERYAFFNFAGAYLAGRFRIPLAVEVNEIAGHKRIRQQCFIALAQAIEKYIFDRAAAIFVVSDFLKEEIEKLGVPVEKIFVIPNAVDPNHFSPRVFNNEIKKKFGISEETVVFGFTGWFVTWHNLELLVEVFSRVAKTHPQILLLLVGDGVLKENLKSLARAMNVADKIIFPGAISYQEIPQYIALMDICVIPGSNEYRSPIKLFEYMAMAKAVVAPRLKPIESIITDGEDGLLFQPDNADSLREAFNRLLCEPRQRKFIGINARTKIEDNHTWLNNAMRIVRIMTK